MELTGILASLFMAWIFNVILNRFGSQPTSNPYFGDYDEKEKDTYEIVEIKEN